LVHGHTGQIRGLLWNNIFHCWVHSSSPVDP
jgi:hypothetical protein